MILQPADMILDLILGLWVRKTLNRVRIGKDSGRIQEGFGKDSGRRWKHEIDTDQGYNKRRTGTDHP